MSTAAARSREGGPFPSLNAENHSSAKQFQLTGEWPSASGGDGSTFLTARFLMLSLIDRNVVDVVAPPGKISGRVKSRKRMKLFDKVGLVIISTIQGNR